MGNNLIHLERGKYLYKKDEFKAAIECLDQAIKIDPNDAIAHYYKGNALYQLGDKK